MHLWRLDDDAIGQYKTVADIPRAYHGVAYVNGYIYVIGGFDGVNYFNTVRRMDVRTFDWIQVKPNSIWILIGKLELEENLNPVKLFRILIPGYFPQEPSMLHKRCYVSVAVMDRYIYALGGMNGDKRWIETLILNKNWKKLSLHSLLV